MILDYLVEALEHTPPKHEPNKRKVPEWADVPTTSEHSTKTQFLSKGVGTFVGVGQWRKDEELALLVIITHFFRGNLEDCTDGETLRHYAARKLPSKLMRVTKKLAGLHKGGIISSGKLGTVSK